MKLLVIIVIIFLFSAISLYGQDSDRLYTLYINKNYKSLEQEYLKHKDSIPKQDRVFFETLFLPDGQRAFSQYEQLFKAGQGRTKYFSAERLKDYYYARGYYSTSSDYQKYLVENEKLIEQNILQEEIVEDIPRQAAPPEKMYIQVGAFGLEANARQMVQMLKTQKVDSRIMLRKVRNQKLYCVWVSGKTDFDNTVKFADELKEKYHLDYKIIKE